MQGQLPGPGPRLLSHTRTTTLWCGGYILAHPEFLWRIVSLCRAEDLDRAPKFRRVLQQLKAEVRWRSWMMTRASAAADRRGSGDHRAVIGRGQLQPDFDSRPEGEYTQHRRHEECCQSVVELWRSGRIDTEGLWMFAYEDGAGRTCLVFAMMQIGERC